MLAKFTSINFNYFNNKVIRKGLINIISTLDPLKAKNTTGRTPIHVSRINVLTKIQNNVLFIA